MISRHSKFDLDSPDDWTRPIYSDDPFYTVTGNLVSASYFPTSSDGSTAITGSSGSVVAVTSNGFTINLIFDAAAMAAPASFRSGIQQAAAILASDLKDKITVNLKIDYSGTGGGASAGPDSGYGESYSWVHSMLVNNASPGDTTFSSLPSGSSVQGQSNVVVWNAQLKLWGVLGANDTTTDDGSANFATDINPNLLVGVALHELTHALGRVPYGSTPDIFDLYRFTSPGVRLFQGSSTAPAAYFSLDGGNTKLADYGRNSDPSDFLNSGVQGPNDPFNEYYTGSTLQQLTTVDLTQLDALGFHIWSPDTQPSTITVNNPLSIAPGATLTITSSLLSATDDASSGANLLFSVTASPAEGTLLLNGTPTTSFTEADLSNGVVSYHETAPGPASDSFQFTVTDAAGNTSAVDTFHINVSANNHSATSNAFDFDGNGTADLLLNSSTQGVAVWLMNGATVTANPQVGTIASGFHYAAHGDFNGDGNSDLLMINDTTHAVVVWEMNGTQVTTSQTIGTINASAGWQFTGTGDFNGDGQTDLLLTNSTTNGVAIWTVNGTQVTANPQIGTINAAAGWSFGGTGDFDGDGKTDLLMLNSTTHGVAIWEMNGTKVTANPQIGTINAGAGWAFAGTGDFDGDGKTDLLLLNSTTNGVAIWKMNGTQVMANPQIGTINAGAGWAFAGTGDFNGDGRTDLLLLNSTTKGVAIWELDGTHVIANPQIGTMASGFSFDSTNDFNGDHKTDLLFENSTTHALVAWEMNGTQVAVNQQIGTVNDSAGWHIVT
ncbi:NF038122 family metalloprotease [Bradyrhizobium sp. WSM3983]|uniref:NF038122 family metalloprotease n=1 Tax=Bradyrhizobium sp. WSM3983 TaxID=1038867 RepID=UPI000413BB64|nr:NF038122 family metalloprotease [Bradyrhizobium sp. WSM3983]